jgi:hypothetical protein
LRSGREAFFFYEEGLLRATEECFRFKGGKFYLVEITSGAVKGGFCLWMQGFCLG